VKDIKDTVRSHVRVAYDGSVHKTFRGTNAKERFETEVRVLLHLQKRGCDFVPEVIEYNDETLYLVTTNCGSSVEHLSEGKMQSIFAELEQYGVRHGDPFLRNITYDPRRGRFCVIDFELADIVDTESLDVSTDDASAADPPLPDPSLAQPRAEDPQSDNQPLSPASDTGAMTGQSGPSTDG
jgi:hypothetical protein